MTMAATECLIARKRSAATSPSSVKDAAQFVTGSGLVLIAARAPAFNPWAARATAPARRAATVRAGSETPLNAEHPKSAAAGTRMNVWTVSHSESTIGILSATNSTT